MKKLFILVAVLTLTFTLSGCGEDVKDLPDEMTMAELDDYLGRDDVQYVDLRDFDEKMVSGYVQGFEAIPYFDYLKYQGILNDANGGWVFDDGEVLSEASMKALFNMDKTILLMCGSGTRAEYVKAALESIGFTDVINIGGFAAYVTAEGEAVVLGGDAYTNVPNVKGDYTPGTYFGSSDALYTAVVVINVDGGIQSIFFDAVNCSTDSNSDGTKDSDCSTKQILGDGYNMVTYGGANQEWYMQANELAAAILAAQGIDTEWAVIPATGDVHHDYFDVTDAEVIDDVAGVTIGIEGFFIALTDALTQASE